MPLLSLFGLILAAHSPAIQPPKAAVQRRQGVFDILKRQQQSRHLKAVLCSVWEGDRELITVALGESMAGVPASTKMHMRVGGVTLTCLCMILLRLVDEGKVRLDDPISKWRNDLPMSDKVTLRMLANCTTGYPDYVLNEGFVNDFTKNPFKTYSSKDLIAIAMSKPMLYSPGKGWNYSHTNFVILGELLEKITGQSVPQLFKKHIFTPLGLKESAFIMTPDIKPPVLHAYSLDREVYEDSTYWNPSWTSYSGLMTASIGDVATVGMALGSGRLLSKKSRAEQIAPTAVGLGGSTKDRYYGLGVIVLNTWLVQNPRFGGYNLILAYLPSRKLTLAISTTKGPKAEPSVADSTAIFHEIARYLAPEKPLPELK